MRARLVAIAATILVVGGLAFTAAPSAQAAPAPAVAPSLTGLHAPGAVNGYADNLAGLPSPMSTVIGGYTWSDPKDHTDCSGGGCLKLTYRTRLGNQYSDGMYVEAVTISTGGGITYYGAEGHGLSVWNDKSVIKWQTNNDSLNKNSSRNFDLEIMMTQSVTATAGWAFVDVFVPGGNLNQCAKVKVWHNGDWTTANCGGG